MTAKVNHNLNYRCVNQFSLDTITKECACVFPAVLSSALIHWYRHKPAGLRAFRPFHHHYEGDVTQTSSCYRRTVQITAAQYRTYCASPHAGFHLSLSSLLLTITARICSPLPLVLFPALLSCISRQSTNSSHFNRRFHPHPTIRISNYALYRCHVDEFDYSWCAHMFTAAVYSCVLQRYLTTSVTGRTTDGFVKLLLPLAACFRISGHVFNLSCQQNKQVQV